MVRTLGKVHSLHHASDTTPPNLVMFTKTHHKNTPKYITKIHHQNTSPKYITKTYQNACSLALNLNLAKVPSPFLS
jgi:hypothetical protein